jgi:hypothetical protein
VPKVPTEVGFRVVQPATPRRKKHPSLFASLAKKQKHLANFLFGGTLLSNPSFLFLVAKFEREKKKEKENQNPV